jgi:hypothetical protein
MFFYTFAYLFTALLIAVLYLAIAFYAWQRRSVPGAAGLAVLMLAAAGYTVPYVFELNSLDLAAALFWRYVSLPGAALIGPAWLIFAAHFAARKISPGAGFAPIGHSHPGLPAAWTNSLWFVRCRFPI